MITVCLASYNGEKYIKDQISSILQQLTDNDELIITDDGSIDRTIEIINEFNDNRIKLLHNNNCHGVNRNFQNALSRAHGDYIFLSDQDDVWLPGKVSECIKHLSTNSCVVHDCIVVDNNLNVINDSFFKLRNSKKGFWYNIYKNTYLGCCMAFRRELLDYVLPIPNTNCFYHDNWIGCIADLRFNVIYIPFKGILFRRHNANTSSSARRSKFNIYHKLINRLVQVAFAIIRLIKQHDINYHCHL